MTDTERGTVPCQTCGHVKEPSRRLHEIACCGLDSHKVHSGESMMQMTYQLAHGWRGDQGHWTEYAAVQSHTPISETDALAWLERAHDGEVQRRPIVEGEWLEYDWWED